MPPATPPRRRLPRLAGVLSLAVVQLLASTADAQSGSGSSLANPIHQGPGVSNHPVGVVPSEAVRVPPDWPLAEDGSITCLTCHNAAPGSPDTPRPTLRDYDTRELGSAEFCANCHAHDGLRNTATMHWLAAGVAHVTNELPRSRPTGGLFDGRTRQCLSCHDGLSAPESLNDTPWNRGSGPMGDQQRNHPIGVSYTGRTPAGSSVALRAASLLPGHVQLPEGKVSCVSCHDLYAKGKHLLTVPIEGSQLCLTCHDLD